MIIEVMLQIRVATNSHVCVFQTLAFSRIVASIKSDRYLHLLWRRFDMSNPVKRGHASPSGDSGW